MCAFYTRNYFVISIKGIRFVCYKRRMEWNTSNSTWCRRSLTIRYNFWSRRWELINLWRITSNLNSERFKIIMRTLFFCIMWCILLTLLWKLDYYLRIDNLNWNYSCKWWIKFLYNFFQQFDNEMISLILF